MTSKLMNVERSSTQIYPGMTEIGLQAIWKELLSLFFPIAVVLLAGSVVGSFERICLARHSLDALNGSVQAMCVLQVFQLSCIVFANMSQVFVGRYLGAQELPQAGHHTWQMIWIALLSMLLIIPLSLSIDPIFFRGTEQREIAETYFTIQISGNFLFPLGAVLSSFFLAQGKRWLIVVSSLSAYGVHLVLSAVLICGIPSLFPPFGATGAAWSGLIAKLVFCGILFFHFTNRFYRQFYHTHLWKMNFSTIWRCIRVCAPRSAGKAFAMLIWTATTYLMTAKGGNYLLILSIGSTLTLFCSFIAESLAQTLSVVISRYIGSREYAKLWKSLRLGFFFIFILCGILAVPCLFFPDVILSFFHLPSTADLQLFRVMIYWVWGWVLLNSLTALLFAFLLAARDTVFYMIVMSLTWITGFLPIYYCLYNLHWTPDKFWLILVVDMLVVLSLYTWRVAIISKPYRNKSPKKIFIA